MIYPQYDPYFRLFPIDGDPAAENPPIAATPAELS